MNLENKWLEQAEEKLNEKGGSFGRCAGLIKEKVKEKLLYFCHQDEEFAQAVAQGDSFAD